MYYPGIQNTIQNHLTYQETEKPQQLTVEKAINRLYPQDDPDIKICIKTLKRLF